MNQKELTELRRRLRPDRSGISRIYGCYVNDAHEIVSQFDQSLGLMPQEESEKFLSVLKKVLSGSLGKNLMDVSFRTEQVVNSDEHRLLMTLRDSALKDADARQRLFQTVIDALTLEGSYLILLAHDAYDVPFRAKDDSRLEDASEEVYTYFLCAICPVKHAKAELAYCAEEKEFHNRAMGSVAAAPALGFVFPAFDDRRANIYGALYYSHSTADLHQELMDAVFHTDALMAPDDQKSNFQAALSGALADDCSLDVVQSVHEELRERIAIHRQSKEPEPLRVTASEMSSVLKSSGATDAQAATFEQRCNEEFGYSAQLDPANLIDSRRFVITTPDVVVTVKPESSHLVQTRVMGGKKYILISADEGVEVNGMGINIQP